MNPIKSDETAICDNNDGSFACICDDGYEHNSDPAEGFYLNFLLPKNFKIFCLQKLIIKRWKFVY